MTQLHIGVIGAGGRSQVLKGLEHDPRVELSAVMDVSPDRLKWFGKEVSSSARAFTDLKAMLAQKDLDAVAVMSPDALHEEHAVQALKAGKHVYLEKPMATSIEACDKIIATSAEVQRQVMVGFNMRFMPIFKTMREIIGRGDIGDVKAVWVRHFVGRGGDYYFHDWHAQRAEVFSLMLQKASHDLDMIHWLTGRKTIKVAGFGGLDYFGGKHPNDLHCSHCDEQDTCSERNDNERNLCAFRRDVDVEDNEVAVLELEGGIKAAYLQCQFSAEYHRNFTIIGTKGRIENLEAEGAIVIRRRRLTNAPVVDDEVVHVAPDPGHQQADREVLTTWIESLVARSAPPISVLEGRHSVAVGVKIAESIRQGGDPLYVPEYQEK